MSQKFYFVVIAAYIIHIALNYQSISIFDEIKATIINIVAFILFEKQI